MLKIIIVIFFAYAVAEYIKKIWLAVPATIIVALASNFVVTLILVKAQGLHSDAFNEAVYAAIAGIVWYPIIAIIAFFIFRKIMKNKAVESVIFDGKGKAKSVKDRYIEPNKQKNHMNSQIKKSAPSRQQKKEPEPALATELIFESEDISENQLDEYYEKALVEYEEGKSIKSFLSRSIVMADGDKSKERSEYIKLRVENLKKEHSEKATNREKIGNEKKKVMEPKSIQAVNRRLKRSGVSVDGKKYSSIEEAMSEVVSLVKLRSSIRGKTLDVKFLSAECVKKNMSYNDIVYDYQCRINKVNMKINNLKKEFSPVEL